MLGSVVLDGAGWLGVEHDPVGAAVALGVAAVIAGALLIVRAQAGSALEAAVRGRGGWIAVAVGAGAVLPVQGAINAQLRGDLDAPLATGAWSFIVAAATMLLVLAAALASRTARRGRGRRRRCRGGAGSAGSAARPTSPRCSS